MNKNSGSLEIKSNEDIHITTESSKAIEYFFHFKHVITEISKISGIEMTDDEQVSVSIVMLKSLLGEDKLGKYISKMRIQQQIHIN